MLRPLPLAVGGLIALAAAMGIGRFVYTPILPIMQEALELTNGQTGFIASLNFAGYLAGALAAATPILTGSRRSWLLGATALSAVTTGAMAFVSSVAAFALLRFTGGVASAFVLVFSSALVLDRLNAAGRASLSAVHFAGVGTGIALSAIVVSVLHAIGLEWRGLWIASGLASLLAVVAVAYLVPNVDDPQSHQPASGSVLDRRLMFLVAAYGLFGFGYVITATFLVVIVRTDNETRALEPLVWLIVGLAAMPSVWLWARAGARYGVFPAFALACVVEAVSVAASVLWLSTAGVLLAATLLGGTFMGITALGLVAARNLARGDPRRIIGIMTAAFGLGQIVGPVFAGVVSDATGSFLLPSLTAVAALCIAALLARISHHDDEPSLDL
ncbi:MAG: YbfB/YjiJ family MFS transporter [Gammaproteobacteria bacterium]